MKVKNKDKTVIKAKSNNWLSFSISLGKVSITQISLFVKTLAVMLKSGIPITQALEITVESSSGKIKQVLVKVIKSIQAGHSFSSSLQQHPKVFSKLLINSIKIGESSGTLEDNLEHLSIQIEKERDLINKVKSALLYPAIILTAATGLGVFMIIFVLPKIVPLFESLQTELPFSTRTLIFISYFFQNYKLAMAVSLILLIGVGSLIGRQAFAKPYTHWLQLSIPVVSKINITANLARFCRTFGTLLKSGVDIQEALKITKETISNYYYKKAVDQALESVVNGGLLSSKLNEHKKYFPQLVLSMIKSGEQSGKLDETLLYLADYYDKEVDNSAKTLSTVLEPLLLLVLGLAVAFLALAIITPIFKLTGSVNR